jgi:iron complex transport system substrate-binding protein
MTAKRERYEQATERLRTAVAEHPEISVIGYDINSVGDGLFVAQAKGFPDLLGYQEDFGVTFVGPQSKKIIYWEKLSPEKTDTYLADIILYDSREPSLPLTELEQGLPLWNDLPAVQADQIVPWYVPGSGSYTRNAEAMELLAEAIENAQDVA